MTDAALVFPAGKSRWSWLFPGFLFASLCLHLIAFYLFQVAYREPVNRIPHPAALTILRRSNPEDAGILHWIEAEDPALAARPPRVEPEGLLDLAYTPSYDLPLLDPLLPDPVAPQFEQRTGRDFRDVIAQALADRRAPLPGIPAPPTRLVTGPALAARLPSPLTLPSVTVPSEHEPTRFLAGITSGGEVAFVFQQSNSGDAEADRAALQHLRSLKFLPGENRGLTWEMVHYYWGGPPPRT